MTNPYIAQQRAQFAAALVAPATRDEVCAMMVTEDDVHPVPCLESLLNRILYCNSHELNVTILSMLHGGFYGPYNRGMYPRIINQLHASPTLQAKMNAAIATVMAGSDLIHGFTDQGLPTDPNGQRQPQMRLGGNIFNDWGGGPGGHDGAEAWRQTFETSALQTAFNVLNYKPVLEVNGQLDDPTKEMVKWFQAQHPPLKVDGDPGPLTWAAINTALAMASTNGATT
jgi:hypothetical protein